MNDSTKYALEIFKKTLLNENINNTANSELYSKCLYQSSVQEDLDEIGSIFNIKFYNYTDSGLYTTPGVENKIFGFSNAALRDRLGITDNTELSMCYFIMYTILMIFYREATFRTYTDYTSLMDILKECNKNIAMVRSRIPDKASENEAGRINRVQEGKDVLDSFINTVSTWEELPEHNQKSKNASVDEDVKSKSKVGYINRTLRFFESMKILHRDPIQKVYLPTDRFACVVANFYDEYDTKNKIIDLLESSSEEDTENSDMQHSSDI